MLKQRLIFGTLMTLFFTAVVLFGGWLDGSLTPSVEDDAAIQGSIFCLLIVGLAFLAQREFYDLAGTSGFKVFLPITIPGSIFFATCWYWLQFNVFSAEFMLMFGGMILLAGLFLYQNFRYGVKGIIGNCGAGALSVVYLGLLSGFTIAIRVEQGVVAALMFVFVVKGSDIGAYTVGKLFGKHKFSPNISPNKSWEGMFGAWMFGIMIGLLFVWIFNIMYWWQGIVFGIVFAFLGQLSDLSESMLKRDALQKDSAGSVPGFGGVLDVIDSVLFSAAPAYLFFRYIC